MKIISNQNFFNIYFQPGFEINLNYESFMKVNNEISGCSKSQKIHLPRAVYEEHNGDKKEKGRRQNSRSYAGT